MKITVGSERLSMTVTRKTVDDLIVSQHSSERWFENEQDATEALRQIMEAFLEHFTGTPVSHANAERISRKAQLTPAVPRRAGGDGPDAAADASNGAHRGPAARRAAKSAKTTRKPATRRAAA